MSATTADILRRRYRRLLGIYPSTWRVANETVVLDTLLEASGLGERRLPPLREVLALLAGALRAWITRLRVDPERRRWHWLEGLHLGAILLAATFMAGSATQLLFWGTGRENLGSDIPGYAPPIAVFAAVIALTFLLLLRGHARAALVAVGVPVVAVVGWMAAVGFRVEMPFIWAVQLNYPEGVRLDDLAVSVSYAAWPGVITITPLLAVLGVLAWRGGRGVRPRSWKWLLLPAALAAQSLLPPGAAPVGFMVSLVALVVALAVAVTTGEVRPAVALSVASLPWIVLLGVPTLMEVPPASELLILATALALAAAGLWFADRARRRQGQREQHGHLVPHYPPSHDPGP